MIAVAGVLAFATAYLVTPFLRAWARRRGLLDVPNDASSHQVPTPRNGGLAIFLGIVAGTIAGGISPTETILIGSGLLVAALAAVDELRSLARVLRLLAQIAVAGIPCFLLPGLVPQRLDLGGYEVPLGTLSPILFAIVWLVGCVNGFNFMDGLNGLASSAAIVCGGTIAILGAFHRDPLAVTGGVTIASAAAGFMPWNMPSGSIFMGDIGSTSLGFLIGLMVLYLASTGVSFSAAALPLLSFVSDAFLAVIRRAVAGEKFFSTRHTTHFYQRLHQHGWPHEAVTGLWTILMIGSATAAILYDRFPGSRPWAVVVTVMMHVVIFGTIALRRQRCAPR